MYAKRENREQRTETRREKEKRETGRENEKKREERTEIRRTAGIREQNMIWSPISTITALLRSYEKRSRAEQNRTEKIMNAQSA